MTVGPTCPHHPESKSFWVTRSLHLPPFIPLTVTRQPLPDLQAQPANSVASPPPTPPQGKDCQYQELINVPKELLLPPVTTTQDPILCTALLGLAPGEMLLAAPRGQPCPHSIDKEATTEAT